MAGPRDPIARVLQLVAEGRLTADEAAPILDALSTSGPGSAPTPPEPPEPPAPVAATQASGGGSVPRFARIMVMEGGRRVVDLRIPTSLGRFGLVGPLLEVEDPDGDGVRIVLE
ncbi:MAG: hypothetical protein HY263_04570 [Chloroflexi bacterium]|nr:hypothetical protein [Chloroflexota bacterium]